MALIDRETAQKIAATYGTPVYVYSEAALRRTAEEVLAFPAPYGFKARFAMKAASTAAILRLFHSMGIGIDASSGFEARRALLAGIPPTEISLSTQELPQDFADLIRLGIHMNACSLDQLECYGKAFPGTEIGIRLNPGAGAGHNNRTNTGGVSSSFGIWHEYIDRILKIAADYSLQIVRLHTHIGSGGDPEKWQQTAMLSLDSIDRFPDVHTVDLGGGFKVARMPDEKQSDLQVVGNAVRRVFEDVYRRTGRKLRIEIEPGTFLMAGNAVLLTRIQDIVDTGSAGLNFLKVDCGMNDILRPSIYGARHGISLFSDAAEEKSYVVAGHCCESGDILTPAAGEPEVLEPRTLPVPALGDLLLIESAGAYCSSMPAKNYNSFPEAPELMVRCNGELLLIRRKQTLEQIIENEVKDLAL
ncbi:MAG: diaminopimelate decarboxylase [Opitutales bacterium]|nr:diaminopimelate decarboxylase [Opitutales bacterium]